MANANNDQTPRAVELLILAPIGLATMVRDAAPAIVAMFVNRGRNEVEHRQQQLRHVKSTGEVALAFGVPMLKEKIEQRLGRGSPTPVADPPTTAADFPVTANGRHAPDSDPAEISVTLVDLTAVTPTGDLAIPGYDTLSASQVVERLAGLSRDDLLAIRVHEQTHRKRRTILGKIDQLEPELSA